MPKSEQTSWVFANVKGGITRAISQIRRINSVESVTPVTGRFDLVIKLRTNEPNKAFTIVEKIRKIKGITSTQTGISLQKISNTKKDESEDPIAFALVKVKGAFKNVLQKIKSFPNFVEAHIIPGEFDVFAAFHGYSPEELLETSVEKLGSVNGVTGMETLVAWTPTTPY
ncbi:Lrp/AsnC family transcriptional regulator [Candidatus Bathyarchaeota archaeon]|nr:MAG: Lrp/AsnC family transcriptional regulator [Candidatus Bathyarchaeota archaeon]